MTIHVYSEQNGISNENASAYKELAVLEVFQHGLSSQTATGTNKGKGTSDSSPNKQRACARATRTRTTSQSNINRDRATVSLRWSHPISPPPLLGSFSPASRNFIITVGQGSSSKQSISIKKNGVLVENTPCA